MRMTSRTPAATASSTMYWIVGMSTIGRSSLGTALVAGRNRVPRPAAGITAFRIFVVAMAGTLAKGGRPADRDSVCRGRGCRLAPPLGLLRLGLAGDAEVGH